MFSQKISRDLDIKEKALTNLSDTVQDLHGDRRDGPAVEVRDAIRRLAMMKNRITNEMTDKKQQIQHGIARWNEFQSLYSELQSINEWFETREEAMNSYQKIVSRKQFAVALEDVKV